MSLAAVAFALLAHQSTTTIQLNVDGVARTAIVCLPPHPENAPIIFGFHGHGGTAQNSYRRFDLQGNWPEAIAIYPQGLPTTSHYDPEGNHNGWNIRADSSNPDIHLFEALRRLAIDKYHADSQRLFVMGHSNGGGFSYALWNAKAVEIAAFGIFEGGGSSLVSTIPKPIFMTIGANDRLVPARYQEANLAKALEIDSDKRSAIEGMVTRYTGGAPILVYRYAGGHTFQTDAVPLMIEFFKQLPAGRRPITQDLTLHCNP